MVDFVLQAPEECSLLAATAAAILGGFTSRAGLPALESHMVSGNPQQQGQLQAAVCAHA
jgi:hypothetical protein